MLEMKEWDGFEGRLWKEEINVRQFIHHFVNTHACLYFHTIYLPKTGKYK